MAKSGTRKALSIEHENIVARAYGGSRSATSGAAVVDEGDVRVSADRTLFECKGKFGERLGQSPVRSTILSQFEKVADEAFSVLMEPALALRFYAPESPLADTHGYVDLVVRLLGDDAVRSELLVAARTTHEQGQEN